MLLSFLVALAQDALPQKKLLLSRDRPEFKLQPAHTLSLRFGIPRGTPQSLKTGRAIPKQNSVLKSENSCEEGSRSTSVYFRPPAALP